MKYAIGDRVLVCNYSGWDYAGEVINKTDNDEYYLVRRSKTFLLWPIEQRSWISWAMIYGRIN